MFTECMQDILPDEWYAARKSNPAVDVRRLIEKAAIIIRNDFCSKAYDYQVFPSAEEVISGNYDLVPDSLRVLIEGILKPKENHSQESQSVYSMLSLLLFIFARLSPLYKLV